MSHERNRRDRGPLRLGTLESPKFVDAPARDKTPTKPGEPLAHARN